jgi:hypothetical protein
MTGDPLTPDERAKLRAVAIAYGRGYRRCFEDLAKNSSAVVLMVSGQGVDELRELIRVRLGRELGPHFAQGWDSVE